MTFTRRDVAEAFADAWVMADKPDAAWAAFARSQAPTPWPETAEDLREMFLMAFKSP